MSHETLPAGPISKDDRRFVRHLRDVTHRFPVGPATENAVDDFSACLLQILDYDEPDHIVHQRLEIGFFMGGQRVHAKPDVVITDDKDYILLVQEDKRHLSPVEAEPQLIAEAIAAHYENNRRRRVPMLPTMATKVFAGIIMTGTATTFYKIPVSNTLLEAVERTNSNGCHFEKHDLVQ
ncbi:hypothetical protein B0H13DRAFT_1631822 [Mycena leptocephala]|nr:hypothetical protein B0H13DRAFT_1631822 [Mycena leptocephala]